ncbi:unnamed protein product [Euphydryas editha]|uniref:Reverse transcriptase domain-containing protein n=1 Tax=Euphydryas editha TaxID=104508 RepID=A0AAU9VBK9_EUPED|nr:unnamed protein product [Euphydryas editha]
MATNDAVSGIKPPANLHVDSDKSMCWKKWLQQFEWYATAIQLDKKPAVVQAATFMAVIGSDAIEIFNSFNLRDEDQNNLQIIKGKFKEYFAPKTNISFERYIFNKIEQNEDEQFYEFLTRIKTQAKESSNSEDDVYISAISTSGNNNWTEEIKVGNVKFKVKLDTEAECNVLPRYLMDKTNASLKASRTKNLINYTDDKMAVLGETELRCKVKNEETNIVFKIVQENVTPILGLETCEKLRLIARVKTLKETHSKEDIFEGLGCYKDYEYDIDLIENPKLEIKPSRRIPHAIRDEVKRELDRMVKLDVIKPETEPTPAVSPMVVVRQKGKIRICIDPSDVNKNILRRHFPLATIEEISVDIKGSKFFALLDCTKGFWQIKLSERTQKILTFATPWGRYSFKRLPFGVSSAPEIFQKILTNLFRKFKTVTPSCTKQILNLSVY